MIEAFCDWLSRTPVSVAFQTASWFVPLVQTVHIISIAILLTSLYVLGFRLLGVHGGQGVAATLARSARWIWSTLVILLITGALLTITEPARELLNWVFRTKMILVLVLAALVFWLQGRVRGDPGYWSASRGRRAAARGVAVLMFVLGAAIITAGRWIAYV